jgi:hypothetical protein
MLIAYSPPIQTLILLHWLETRNYHPAFSSFRLIAVYVAKIAHCPVQIHDTLWGVSCS